MSSETRPPVYILLSTYNGERYLSELLDSLKTQSYPNLLIRIRDDGSQDRTREILREFSRSNPNTEVDFGENLGPGDSFLQLVRELPEDAAFFGFCDQDDVWDSDKIDTAIDNLRHSSDRPAMSFCRLRIADKDLRTLRLSPVPARPPGLPNALTQSVAHGCTILANRQAIDTLQSRLPPPRSVRMHDWWIYQVVSATGEVRYDPQPHISYRQHADNILGHPGALRKWSRRIARIRSRKGKLLRQAILLRESFGPRMSSDNRALVDRFIQGIGSPSLLVRARFAAHMPVYRQRRIDGLILRVLILLRLA